MRVARNLPPVLGIAALAACVAVLHMGGLVSSDVLLSLVPLLLLVLPLFRGRYVGEDVLARLSARLSGAPRRRIRASVAAVRRSPVVIPRGGLLLACSLARRGPPVVA